MDNEHFKLTTCHECGGNTLADVAIGGLIVIVSGLIPFTFSKEKVKGE